MSVKARQKANVFACLAKDILASLNLINKHSSHSVVVFTRTVKKAVKNLGKSRAFWQELDSTGVNLNFPSQLEPGESGFSSALHLVESFALLKWMQEHAYRH